MKNKTIVTVELFDNGISLKWMSDIIESQHILALDDDKEKTIGKLLLEEFEEISSEECSNIVEISIEYKAKGC